MKKNVLLSIFVLSVVAIFSNGCSSIMCGSEKTVNISSSPTEAKYSIANSKGKIIAEGMTPENVTLKRGAGWFKAGDYTITIEKAGFKKSVQPIKQGLETGWYALGNIVFGGLIGWIIIDPLTGGMYSIEDVNVSLDPEGISMLTTGCYGPRVELMEQVSVSQHGRIIRMN